MSQGNWETGHTETKEKHKDIHVLAHQRRGGLAGWCWGTSDLPPWEIQGSFRTVAPVASEWRGMQPNIKMELSQVAIVIFLEKVYHHYLKVSHYCEKTPDYPKLRDILQNPWLSSKSPNQGDMTTKLTRNRIMEQKRH